MRVRWGIQQNSGFGKTSLSRRGKVMPGKRCPYGVITGLAARKATGIRKGVSPMNRPPLSDKVQAQLNTEQLLDDVAAKRTRQNQKPRLTRTAIPSFLTKREQSDVKKVPKGVPLQFDINSVGKQTGMTLNERFGILKEQRATLTYNKGGSRFVTVG
ncbi:Forty-two-three domain-containing protein 1 [Heterocephalus glaber]|uniref:UAP56-interacting factor n=1 Tax=Heterocephalus glaber TaxID=10181 RepID=G5ALA8_HETGA|nr:Forty-two-three domain-containing protein 1 [Heterocephalus glaber]